MSSSSPFESSPPARTLLRFAFGLLVLAAASSVWAVLANQAPGSPVYLGVLPGPIENVRDSATVLALVFLAVSWWLPTIVIGRAATLLVACACLGATLDLSASVFAAAHGLHAIQFKDHRPDVAPLVMLKTVGQLLLGVCLLDVTRRVWFKRP